jgi:hypothetical protein
VGKHHHHHHRHEHEHEHGERNEEIAQGVGSGKILFLDAPSGLAGDMIIAALVDLGVPQNVVQDALSKIALKDVHVHFGTRARSGIVGTSFDVHVEGEQPERTFKSIREMLEASALDARVKARALATFEKLAHAEAKVHRSTIDEVHFHEVGAVDAIVDVVGSAAALEHLGARMIVSPLPMGRGFVKARHGTLPLPAPATVECLAGFPTYDAGIEFELVTPTGAAIVAANATGSSRWPSFSPERVGWGAGAADLKDRANLLRAVLGTPNDVARDGSTHVVLEANLDDATGELVASALEIALAEGALDAWSTPITMKKGRPAVTVSVLAVAERADALAHVLLRETTSLGVRRYRVDRVERPRRVVVVHTPYGKIPVKVAEGPFGPPQVKPEHDACAAAAKAHGVPLREVMRAALVAAGVAAL